ncbi:Strictosidine synthase 1 [Hordeum vulgare]|nr:Strictosidine synthase 1 [Hordeum vulgare]
MCVSSDARWSSITSVEAGQRGCGGGEQWLGHDGDDDKGGKWHNDVLKHRLRLRPQWTTSYAKSLHVDGSEDEAYHDSITWIHGEFREYGPLMNIVDALSSIPGTRDSKNKLRGTMKKFINHCRKLVDLLGCASSADTHAPRGPVRTLASSIHVASSSRLVEEDEEEENDEEEHDKEQAEEEEEEEGR